MKTTTFEDICECIKNQETIHLSTYFGTHEAGKVGAFLFLYSIGKVFKHTNIKQVQFSSLAESRFDIRFLNENEGSVSIEANSDYFSKQVNTLINFPCWVNELNSLYQNTLSSQVAKAQSWPMQPSLASVNQKLFASKAWPFPTDSEKIDFSINSRDIKRILNIELTLQAMFEKLDLDNHVDEMKVSHQKIKI